MTNTKYRIGVDARTLFSPEKRGIGKTLLKIWNNLPIIEKAWEYYLYCYSQNDNIQAFPLLNNDNIKIREINMPGLRFNTWEQIRLPIAVFRDNLDLLHCPAQTAPYYVHCPKIITVHDLIPLKINDGWTKARIHFFRRNIKHSLRTAKKIITISEYSKKDILETFTFCQEDKIEVIYWGPECEHQYTLDEDKFIQIRNKYSINRPYLFAFGAISPRKNTARLLQSFTELVKKLKQEILLLVVGLQAEAKEYFREYIATLGIEDQVLLTGFVPENDIPYLFNGAIAFIYISLYEGFGLPLLDSMIYNCPVIASNLTSIPEVAGDAALLVDPYNISEISITMESIVKEKALRQELIERGKRRVKQFSWQEAYCKTLKIYRDAIEKN